MSLTGIIDTDREILRYVEDRELLKICSINKTFYEKVSDDAFLRRRLSKYPEIEKYRKEESLKKFFSKVAFCISEMREKFKFEYTEGNFEIQYTLLKNFPGDELVPETSKVGELNILKYAIRRCEIDEFPFELYKNRCLGFACENGHYEIVKYLVTEKGANIHNMYDYALVISSANGFLDIVKFLVNSGATVQTMDNMAVRYASVHGHFEIVKYLVTKGANPRDFNDYALTHTRENGHFEIAQYIESL